MVINGINTKYQLTTTLNQNKNENNELSTVKLGKCENELRNAYTINDDQPLLILIINIDVEGFLSSIVEYEVFHPVSKKILNLTHCQGLTIETQVPLEINEEEEFKYNPLSEYYNEICSTYTTENGTDITLKDRRKEYANKNLALCEPDCTYSGYDYNTKKAICQCSIKTQIAKLNSISIDKDKIIDIFTDLKSVLNLNVIKCFTLLFSSEGHLYNIGNYILSPIIAMNIMSSMIFYLKGYKKLKNQINQMVNRLKQYKKNANNNINKNKNNNNK